MTDIETIRRRHRECCVAIPLTDWEPEGGQAHVDRADLIRIVGALSAELAAERERIIQLERALKALQHWNTYDDGRPDDDYVTCLLTAGSLRRARAALEGGA